MFTRPSPHLFLLIPVFMLAACAYQRPAGDWHSIKSAILYFSEIELPANAVDPTYPDLCREAKKEMSRQLLKRLPARIKPLALQVTKVTGGVEFQMKISNCAVDFKQWDASFTYYLTLNVDVVLKDKKKILMAYSMETYEQLQTDIPSPDFDFTFEEPIARSLNLFEAGRVWVPVKNN